MSAFVEINSSGVYKVTPTPGGAAGQKLNNNFDALVSADASNAAAITAHAANQSNPHAVTAAQVGAAPAAQGISAVIGSNPIALALNATTHTLSASISPATTSAAGSMSASDKTALDALHANQTANKVYAAPNGSTGAPMFRLLAAEDIPDLSSTYVTQGYLTAGQYATTGDISSALTNYVTTSTLNSALSSYATTASLSSYQLAGDYATHSDLSTAVAPLVSLSSLTATLSGYRQTSTAINESEVTNLTSDLAAKAPTADPTFSGTATFDGVVIDHTGSSGDLLILKAVAAHATGSGFTIISKSDTTPVTSYVAQDNAGNLVMQTVDGSVYLDTASHLYVRQTGGSTLVNMDHDGNCTLNGTLGIGGSPSTDVHVSTGSSHTAQVRIQCDGNSGRESRLQLVTDYGFWNIQCSAGGGGFFDIVQEGFGVMLRLVKNTGNAFFAGSICVGSCASDPTSPSEGQFYFNSGDKHFYGWNGTAWKQLDN